MITIILAVHWFLLSLCCVVLFVWWIMYAVEIRNRMRSVDDLMYYGKWKRESLHAHSARGHNDDRSDRGFMGSEALNQSYSCASTLTTATDDDGRPGTMQRRRRTRLRRRSTRGLNSSIVSAPTTRRVNLDDSVGSGALDVDSMFRFFASSTCADDGICNQRLKPGGLPPSGLPPSGTAGRTTSVRRTSLRRRRRQSSSVTDVVNCSTDMSTSFDDVQMTSSAVDLKDATAENSSMQRSRPVRRSLRRRRRTSKSPVPTGAQDLTDVAAPVTSTTAALADVTKPEALWELCGEKLNELCRRILHIGVADDVVTKVTSPVNITESAHTEIKVVQPVDVVEESLPRIETPIITVPERQRTNDEHNNGIVHSVDSTASHFPNVIPDLDQPVSKSSDPTDRPEDSCNGVESTVTGVGSSAMDHQDDIDFSGKPASLTAVAADDVDRHDSLETAVSCVPPSDVEHDVVQFYTATYSPEHCHSRLEPEGAIETDQLTVGPPLMIGENHVVHAVDVPHQLNDDRALSVVKERRGSPDIDISAMLSPSIDLQGILDTIYTLTSGVSEENDMTDEDGTPSRSPRALSPENPASSDENGCANRQEDYQQLLGDSDNVHLAEHSAAVCLDRADDDDENSLDLDTEMYDYDLSLAAADLANSVRLAIAEDDDDLDIIADYEYDLDDNDIL